MVKLTASGTISIDDADQGQASFSGATDAVGSDNLGSLDLQSDGTYTYTVSNDAVQYLGEKDSQTEMFTVTALDGTTKDVGFTIHGANDEAVIGDPTVTDVTEDQGVSSGMLTASGTISIDDADQGQVGFSGAVPMPITQTVPPVSLSKSTSGPFS